MLRFTFLVAILVSAASFGCGPEKEAKNKTAPTVTTSQLSVKPEGKVVAKESQTSSPTREVSSGETQTSPSSVNSEP